MNDTRRCQWCGCILLEGQKKWCSVGCSMNGNKEISRYRKAVASPAGRNGYYKTSLRIIKRRIPMRLSSSLTSCQWEHLVELHDAFSSDIKEEIELDALIGKVLEAPGKEPLPKDLIKEIKGMIHNKKIVTRPAQVKIIADPWESNWSLVGDPSQECMRKGFRVLVKVKTEEKTTHYQLDLRCTPGAGPEVGIWETDPSDMSPIGGTEVFPYKGEEGISKEGLSKFVEKFNWTHFMQQMNENTEGENSENMQKLQ